MGLTLLQDNAFEFHPGINIPEQIGRMVRGIAYNCLLYIIREKFKKVNTSNGATIREKCYFFKGRTGSGKSTYLPSHLFTDLNVSIWVIEPKVVLAQSIPVDIVGYDRRLKIGKNIGYKTGQGTCEPENDIGLTFMTTEIFRQQLVSGKKLPSIVIIDEVHQMDSPLMFCLHSLKEKLPEIEKTLFIFQSATIDLPLMTSYFLGKEIYDYDVVGYVKGSQNFPCEEIWIDDSKSKNFITKPIELVKFLMEEVLPRSINSKSTVEYEHRRIPARDILLFVCGKKTILNIRKSFENYRSNIPFHFMDIDESSYKKVPEWRNRNKNKLRLLIVPYISGLSCFAHELLKTNIDPNPEAQLNEIKLFISTPVLEAGKTIDTLYQVIDNGLKNDARYNPLTYDNEPIFELIKRVPADKSGIEQRVGRVGRKAPGIVIRLYSKETYEKIPDRNVSDNINTVVYTDKLFAEHFENNEVIDLMAQNQLIESNSIDTMIRTSQDLINIGMMTTFGEYLDKTIVDDLSQMDLQINELRFIQDCSLSVAALYSRLNRNNFSKCMMPLFDIVKNKNPMTKKDTRESILEIRKKFYSTIVFDF